MSVDWLATLREHGEVATQMAREIPAALSNPSLTLEQVTQLFQAVNNHCLEIEQLIERLEEEDVDDSLHDVAESIDGIWGELAEALAKRMIEMRGGS